MARRFIPADVRRIRQSLIAKRRSRPVEPFWLVVEHGDKPLRSFPLAQEWTRIGRSLAADLRFDEPSVSRRHVLIVIQPDGVRVLDDRSLQGVFVNGAKVEGQLLSDGDLIQLGSVRLWFMDLAAAADIWDVDADGLDLDLSGGAPLRPEWQERIGPLLARDEIDLSDDRGGRTATLVSTEAMLCVDDGLGHRMYPAFQFDPATRQPYAVVAQVVALFREASIDDYTAAAWFRSPQALLAGNRPADWLADHRDQVELVEAARRTISRLSR